MKTINAPEGEVELTRKNRRWALFLLAFFVISFALVVWYMTHR